MMEALRNNNNELWTVLQIFRSAEAAGKPTMLAAKLDHARTSISDGWLIIYEEEDNNFLLS